MRRRSDPHTIGLLSVAMPSAKWVHLDCFVDEQEVTHRTIAADDREGWALCYCVNAQGRWYFKETADDDVMREYAVEFMIGRVVFRDRRAPATARPMRYDALPT